MNDADIMLREDDINVSQFEALRDEIKALKNHVKPETQLDSLAERVMISMPLRDIVHKLAYLDGNMLKIIDGVIYGFMASKKLAVDETDEQNDEEEKREEQLSNVKVLSLRQSAQWRTECIRKNHRFSRGFPDGKILQFKRERVVFFFLEVERYR